MNEPPATQFVAHGGEWVGQVYELRFPTPIDLQDRSSVSACRVRVGIRKSFLDQVQGRQKISEVDEVVREADLDLKMPAEHEELQRDSAEETLEGKQRGPIARHSTIQLGNTLMADLEMLER